MRVIFFRLPTLVVIVILVCLNFNGCQRSAEKTRENTVILSPRLQKIFDQTRTVCFGRFLIQIPSTARVIYGPAEVELPIEFYPGEGKKLNEHLASRLAEIEQEREFLLKTDIPRLPMFGKVIDGILPGQKIVFGSKNQAGYAIHSFIPLGNHLFVQYINSTSPKNDEIPVLNRIASHLQLRADDDIPSNPGVCIEGGFIPLEQDYEHVTIGIRLKEFSDIHISIDAHKNLERLSEGSTSKVLRQQAKESAEANALGAVFARTKILRERDRKLSEWDGEEQALRTPAYKDDKSVHDFRFYSTGAVNDRLHPELDIRLDSGVKGNEKARIDPSLTDEEALALWDKLITTIRLRQPSDATPPKAPPRIPLASVARTGETCPQTGWWECSEHHPIEGGPRRLLKAGERMPHAPLLDEPGLWKKLTGVRPIRPIASTWTLVQYDEDTSPPSA